MAKKVPDIVVTSLIDQVLTPVQKSQLSAFKIVLMCTLMISFRTYAGSDQRTSIIHDNLKRAFTIYVPSLYVKSTQLPLVIALHGRGGNGSSMRLITRKGFNKLADNAI